MSVLIKLVGACVTVGGTFSYGLYLSFMLKHRINCLISFRETLMIMEGQIRYMKMSVPGIIRYLSDIPLYDDIGELYKCVGEGFDVDERATFYEIWNGGVDECRHRLKLVTTEEELYRKLGNLPVNMDVAQQTGFLNELADMVNGRIKWLNSELNTKGKVYKSVGLAAGLLIVIMLI